MDAMDELIGLVKDKSELRGISDEYVGKRVAEYIEDNPQFVEKFGQVRDLKQFTRTGEYKDMLKEVRSTLREVYGAFIMNKYKKIREAVEKVCEEPTLANHLAVLGMHRSSKERLPFYEEVYKKIFDITGEPGRILDLACGLNPFSYPLLGYTPEYLASDISPELCGLMQDYFDSQDIEGTAFVFDLMELEENAFSEHAHADVCFLFKALDSLETIEWDFTEKVLDCVPADWLVISFARHSLGGKKMAASDGRDWVDDKLNERGLEYEFFMTNNEMFYVVKNY